MAPLEVVVPWSICLCSKSVGCSFVISQACFASTTGFVVAFVFFAFVSASFSLKFMCRRDTFFDV